MYILNMVALTIANALVNNKQVKVLSGLVVSKFGI